MDGLATFLPSALVPKVSFTQKLDLENFQQIFKKNSKSRGAVKLKTRDVTDEKRKSESRYSSVTSLVLSFTFPR